MRRYWTDGPGSQPIQWIGEQPPPSDSDTVKQRIEALEAGVTQWGCAGAHHGNGTRRDCPTFLHHHHDYRCAPPTEQECEAAGVEYRARWASRA